MRMRGINLLSNSSDDGGEEVHDDEAVVVETVIVWWAGWLRSAVAVDWLGCAPKTR